ncbi:MAG: hypothetical protein AAF639_03905 [Chloroflexota bacterium]
MKPQDLLDENRPALLPLLGQAQIERPDEIMPQVYEAIKSVPEQEMQQRLLTELLALLQDKEIIRMIETMIEQDELVLDTPYIRRWREQGLAQGRAQEQESRREDILNLILWRYNPPAQEYLQVQKFLASIMTDRKFKTIIDAIMNVENFSQFYEIVENASLSPNEMEAVPA